MYSFSELFDKVFNHIFLNLGTVSVECHKVNHLHGGKAVAVCYECADLRH